MHSRKFAVAMTITLALLAPSKCTEKQTDQPTPNPCVKVSQKKNGVNATPANCRR